MFSSYINSTVILHTITSIGVACAAGTPCCHGVGVNFLSLYMNNSADFDNICIKKSKCNLKIFLLARNKIFRFFCHFKII